MSEDQIHFKALCQFGYVHKQCRCPVPAGKVKAVLTISCDREGEHTPIEDGTDAGFLNRITRLCTTGYRLNPSEVQRMVEITLRLQKLDSPVSFDPTPPLIWDINETIRPPFIGVGQKVNVKLEDGPTVLYEVIAEDEKKGTATLTRVE